MITISEVNPVIVLPDFSFQEFDCKCGCGLNNMQAEFLWKLQMTRTEAQVRFLITSGCRCVAHNAAVGGSPTSDHLDGRAADVYLESSRHRYRIRDAANMGWLRRIGHGTDFIHLSDNPKKPQGVEWVY